MPKPFGRCSTKARWTVPCCWWSTAPSARTAAKEATAQSIAETYLFISKVEVQVTVAVAVGVMVVVAVEVTKNTPLPLLLLLLLFLPHPRPRSPEVPPLRTNAMVEVVLQKRAVTAVEAVKTEVAAVEVRVIKRRLVRLLLLSNLNRIINQCNRSTNQCNRSINRCNRSINRLNRSINRRKWIIDRRKWSINRINHQLNRSINRLKRGKPPPLLSPKSQEIHPFPQTTSTSKLWTNR